MKHFLDSQLNGGGGAVMSGATTRIASLVEDIITAVQHIEQVNLCFVLSIMTVFLIMIVRPARDCPLEGWPLKYAICLYREGGWGEWHGAGFNLTGGIIHC